MNKMHSDCLCSLQFPCNFLMKNILSIVDCLARKPHCLDNLSLQALGDAPGKLDQGVFQRFWWVRFLDTCCNLSCPPPPPSFLLGVTMFASLMSCRTSPSYGLGVSYREVGERFPKHSYEPLQFLCMGCLSDVHARFAYSFYMVGFLWLQFHFAVHQRVVSVTAVNCKGCVKLDTE